MKTLGCFPHPMEFCWAIGKLKCFLLGKEVRKRHEFILPLIGALPQEEDAYFLVQLLHWRLPFVVSLLQLWIIDLITVSAYMVFFHPWKDIVKEVDNMINTRL